MEELFSKLGYSGLFGIIWTSFLIRYLLFSGISFWVVWILFEKKFFHKLIQGKKPAKENIIHEVKYSFVTFFIFALSGVFVVWAKRNGYNRIYENVEDYGVLYLIFSLLALIFLHDFYFYWTHRMMHHKFLFKHVHLAHHKSINPSPWAAFSFHPLEAIIEAGIVPIVSFVLPLHPGVMIVFFVYMTSLNVLGHLSYEFFPSWFLRNKFTNWHNTATHHNMHHKYVNCNYSLYFNFWDKIMRTNHEKYKEKFEEVASRLPNKEYILEKSKVLT
ncbi:Fatty acid hydroxylase family protein [Leptospira interrogans serovar Manilae]|uniref:Fatty acid hydroxylase family protein n=1 Tax=Leptospira interrogans serovar Manilae TaxID=214675 RepID=A0AAQ1SP41_LEPIR|nr:sterol desaturase family protein [Leptospira interrogans]AKP25347.1 sterol desaturase [Leptospira interrogans serovar Manilae]AKP29131.1 sterol desaturase [Leptospira interrogans serovar Manilae]EYU63598.1 sterol desaturase [Leptospira interrogans serovar Manilae]SOR61884.1 Fatty acid hydroxylase family protein [Leptospira interrogans serovar Manilae]